MSHLATTCEGLVLRTGPKGALKSTASRTGRSDRVTEVMRARQEQGWMDTARSAVLTDVQGSDPLQPYPLAPYRREGDELAQCVRIADIPEN